MIDTREQEMQHKIDTLAAENTQLKQQVAFLKKQVFGRKSEKKTVLYPDEQMSLFDEAETEAKKNAPEPELVVKEHTRKKKKIGHREELLAAVPHQKVVIDLDEDAKVCPHCGSGLSLLGETFIRQEITYIPARVEVTEYYQKSYECRNCRQQETPVIQKAVMPQPVIAHSYASPTAVAHTMIQKYGYALPLYRQEKEWQQLGIRLERTTLANWIILAANEWLQPIVSCMHEALLQEPCIHADETPAQVLHEKGKKNTSKSYMWLYASGQFETGHAIRIFDYQPTRKGDHASTFLEGFHGYLHTDDYGGYGKVNQVQHCLCWSHVRRKFVDAKPASMSDETGTLVREGMDQIGQLFAIEKTLAGMTAEERKPERLRQEKPLLEAFWVWAESYESKVLPKSKISTALHYALSNKEGLERYLTDGRCAISNNLAENSIRPFTIGRKNWLFSGSPKGAAASACVYSIIETCKANGIDAEKYLIHLFQQLPNVDITQPAILEQYLPWNPAIKEICK